MGSARMARRTLLISIFLGVWMVGSCHQIKVPGPTDPSRDSNKALEADNVYLRKRIVTTSRAMYALTPPEQRDATILAFLKDGLGEIRVLGLTLAMRKDEAGEEVGEDIRSQINEMLSDEDPRVRGGVAMLMGMLGDPSATEVLLKRLRGEQSASVREALLKGLGQLRDPRAVEAILERIRDSQHQAVVRAGAGALVRIAEKHPLSGTKRKEAVRTLLGRYKVVRPREDTSELREGLLGAMGVVGDKGFVPVLLKSLRDEGGAVRLAAVNALVRFKDAAFSDDLVGLLDDSDRGVRRAVITGLGETGGRKHLSKILRHTDPAVEPDSEVCKEGWNVVMKILQGCDRRTLESVSEQLKRRPDAATQRIEVLQLLVEAMRNESSERLPEILHELGKALLDVPRFAEAAAVLEEAYESYHSRGDRGGEQVWREWVEAMLGPGDPEVTKVMLEQDSDELFSWSLENLQQHLIERMNKKDDPGSVSALASKAARELAPRLTVPQREKLDRIATKAQAHLTRTAREKVLSLVTQLKSPDEQTRKGAASELQKMGQKAVPPLLQALKRIVQPDQVDPATEQEILAVLKQIAPKLTGYDPTAPTADRIKVVEDWIKVSSKGHPPTDAGGPT